MQKSLKIKQNVIESSGPTYWWGRYRGKSLGKVLHFLQCYCGMSIAESCTVGTDYVRLGNKNFATFVWSTESLELPNGQNVTVDVPVFVFVEEFYSEEQKSKLLYALKNLDVYIYADRFSSLSSERF